MLSDYQCKAEEIMFQTGPWKNLCCLIEGVFTDRYLYEHQNFRELVQANHKGYVWVQDIVKEPQVKEFIESNLFADNHCYDGIHKELLEQQICAVVNGLSRKLRSRHRRIRRIDPFANRFDQFKPMYIEEYPQEDNCQQLESLISAHCKILKISYNHIENWALIHVDNTMALLRLNGWEWGNKKCFMVQSHEDTAKQFNFTNSIRVYQRYQEPYAENDEKEEIYERGMLEEDDEDDYKTEYLRRITERQRQQQQSKRKQAVLKPSIEFNRRLLCLKKV